MKLLKTFVCGYLGINNVYNINKIGINSFKKTLPNKYPSFKKTKQHYYNNNVYYDIYKDEVNDFIDKPYIKTNKIHNFIKYFFQKMNNIVILNNKVKNVNREKNDLYSLKYNKYNDLTAEHIFPQSFIKEYPKAKFDMHNIYLTESKINSHRSNYKYKDESEFIFINNNIKYIKLDKNEPLLYNYYDNYKHNKLRIFIPSIYSRGSIARTIIYMKYIYENLIIENVIDIDTLIKWNKLYPPNKMEIKQNELIYKIQGNYNIFILYPKLVEEYIDTLYK